MAMSSTTANWHWKTKHVSAWARDWFKGQLVGLSSSDGDEVISIERVNEVDGDVEIGQRKSKLITIYDCRVALAWSATGPNDASIKGTLTIPEVSHENTLDGVSDYTYEYSTTSTSGESSATNALFTRVKSVLPRLLEAKFREFPQALIDTHGKDITVVVSDNGTPSGSGTTTPAIPSTKASAPAKSTPTATKSSNPRPTGSVKVSSQTQRVSGNFQASAQDLWDMLTNERRMPIWSQAPAQSNPTVGGSWSLLGGSVVGTYISLEPYKKIVQQWRMPKAPGWPSDIWATLEINLNQGSDSTELEMVMSGVPSGKEEEVQQGLENYYIRGFKSIGYVQVFPTTRSPSLPPSRKIKSASTSSPVTKEDAGIDWKGYAALAVAGLLLAFSFVPVFMNKLPPLRV